MKCPRHISMPSGIQHWLEEQLETHGIDTTIYSKYVFSVLSNESSDFLKLKDCELKNLVGDLSAKLKGFEEKGLLFNTDLTPSKHTEDSSPSSIQEKVFRYYSAFPPLITKSKTDYTHSFFESSSSVQSGKQVFGSFVGKNRSISEGNYGDHKFNNIFYWLEENKENSGYNRDDAQVKMRSRSTVKQQTSEKYYRNMAKSLDRKEDLNKKAEVKKNQKLYEESNKFGSEYLHALWATEKSFDDLTGCDQDLPMDFQQLLESPEATKMSFDLSGCTIARQPSSFIQCGTNITSSIWSEKAEDTMDCSVIGETSNDLSFRKSVWGITNDVPFKACEVVQKSADDMKINMWSTGESNAFNNDSWKVIGSIDNKEPLVDFSKCCDIEGTSLLLNESDSFFSSIGSTLHSSLTTLNHNKKDSSFTEVIPKLPSLGNSATKDIVNEEPAITLNENNMSRKEEEDLLTSMRTHFRPIKQETTNDAIPSTTVPIFPDGTTFPISNSLDEPNFHRSPCGGLYLDSDANCKYMEFNDTEDDKPSEFVPKFRVRQNEKFCQTEELPQNLQRHIESNCEELYFPEDEKLVRSMVEDDEVEEEEEENSFWRGETTCIKVDGWVATWPTSGIWSNEPNVQQIWCDGNMWNTSSDSISVGNQDDEGGEKGGDQYTRLRNEWTQEAEELLSDISQQLYLANYVDAQPPKTSLVESAWNQLSTTPFTRALPLQTSYSVMQL